MLWTVPISCTDSIVGRVESSVPTLDNHLESFLEKLVLKCLNHVNTSLFKELIQLNKKKRFLHFEDSCQVLSSQLRIVLQGSCRKFVGEFQTFFSKVRKINANSRRTQLLMIFEQMHAISNRLVSLEPSNILISSIFSSNLIGTSQSLGWLDLKEEIWRHSVCLIQFYLIQVKLEGRNILVDYFLLLRSISSHLAMIFLVITRGRIGVVGGGRIFAQIGSVWVSSDWNCTLGR